MNTHGQIETKQDDLAADADAFVKVGRFEVPPQIDEAEQQELCERFSFILVNPGESEAIGGSGVVVNAYDVHGERFALKMLRLPQRISGLSIEEHERFCQRRRDAFREEFVLLSHLASFTQFPDVYGFGEVEGAPAIFMEWIEGISLEQLLQVGDLFGARESFCAYDVALVGRSLFGVLEVLERRGRGFVHRDLSPANIMVRTSRFSVDEQMTMRRLDICLIDFGTSVLVTQSSVAEGWLVAQMRGTTFEYAPPEMLDDDAFDAIELRNSPKVDVYAACSVLYELLWGDTPFRLYALGSCDPARTKVECEPNRDLPVTSDTVMALGSIITQGLAAQQGDRPGASAMGKMFDRFLETYAWCDMDSDGAEFPKPIDTLVFFPPDSVIANRAASNDAFNNALMKALSLKEGFGKRERDIAEEGVEKRFFWRIGRHFAVWMTLLLVIYTFAVLNVGYSLHELFVMV